MDGKGLIDSGTPVPHSPGKPPESLPVITGCIHMVLPKDHRGTHKAITSYNFKLPKVSSEVQQGYKRPHSKSSLQFSGNKETPSVTIFKIQSDQSQCFEKYHHGPVPLFTQNPYFRRGGDKPKVQMSYISAPGQIPRKLAIERRRREYLLLDFENLLKERGIDSNCIMQKHLSGTERFLPLEMFDNEDYDCRTPDDWITMGDDEELPDQKPLPGKALLPTSSCVKYSWYSVGVLGYSKEKHQYLVEKVHENNKEPQTPGVKPFIPGTKHWVPRIRLLFFAEDPRIFVERLQFALRCRENTESLLFNQSAVDCMPIWKGTPTLDTTSLQRIEKHVRSTPRLKLNIDDKCTDKLAEEVKLKHSRVMNGMIFVKVVMRNPEEFSNISLPLKEPELVPLKGCISVPQSDYKTNKAAFIFYSLLMKPDVIQVLSEIWFECNKVANMRLFNITSVKPLRLEDFEVLQSQVHTQMTLYLQESWMLSLSNSIRSNVANIVQGAYNINESHWDMYKLSKLYRLMAVVRLKMQDSLRHLVMDSLHSLTHCLLHACQSVLTCPEDLVWGHDLVTSPYKPKNNPLFLVDLVLDQASVHYSTPLEKFETSLIKLFDEGILVTYKIPQLDKFVMKKLFFGGDPLIMTVNIKEPEVTDLRLKVHNALVQAAIPLRAYAAKYEEYLELYNLDIEAFIGAHMNREQTVQHVRADIQQLLEKKDRIEDSLPSSIVIGPFIVRVEAVRQALANKTKALVNSMLNHLALKLSKRVDDVCEECNVISRKLQEKPDCIEELSEKRKWMKHIPEQLKGCKELLEKIVLDYEILEELFFCPSNEDFNKKWVAIGWPQKIISQMEATTAKHVEDEELFCKIHQSNLISLEEQLSSLGMLVAGLGGHGDINHAHELANDMRRTSKQLKECQALAQTYNTRERLLGLPVTGYDHLKKPIQDLQPFKDLWTTASDWLRWHDSWLNDPLTSIDPEQLGHSVAHAQETMQKCFEHFKDIPDCQVVATVIHGKIEEFRPHVPLIQGLRKPGMRSLHWEMLSERIQMTIKPKANLTLSRCLELGLQNHMSDIAHVAEAAGEEFNIEKALQKMEEEWATVSFDVLSYKDSGTYILRSPDEVSRLVDDHITMMHGISSSPFKEPFESRISSWESKLILTQDVIKEWMICQQAWLDLEAIFSCNGLNQQLSEERKLFQQMEQTWRALMETAFNNPKVINLCPDTRLLNKLKRCRPLLEQVQKGLCQFEETKQGSSPPAL